MELREMIADMSDVGCGFEQEETAMLLYESGQTDELVRYLKKCRCSLMDEMHESQRRVDRMDYLIRRAEKETIKISNCRRAQK